MKNLMIDKQPVHKQQLVVVLGMHRSGTSAITAGLEALGIKLGNRLMPPFAGNNDKGFYEDLDIVAFNEELLNTCGKYWYSVEPIQSVDADYLCDRGYFLRAVELLRNKLMANESFGFKDPRTAKLMPFWSRVFAAGGFNVRFVFAFRNPLSVARSLERRDGFCPEHAYILWVDSVLAILSFLQNQPVIAVDYDQLLHDPEEELGRLAAWLDRNIDQEALTKYRQDFLEESLRHSRFSPDDVYVDIAASALAKDIYGFFIDVQAGNVRIEHATESGRLKQWEEELYRLRPALRLLDKQYHQIISLSQAATERDGCIADLSQAVTERDGQIASLNQAVTERDGQIAGLNQAVTERDGQIAGLNQAVTERDGQIAGLNQAVTERDGQIASLNQAVTERDGHISAMFQSTSWRLTSPYRILGHQVNRIRHIWRLLPSLLRHGGGVKATTAKACRIYRMEGLEGLKRRLIGIQRVATSMQPDAPNLRHLVVSSYAVWSEHFDTPSREAVNRMAQGASSKRSVLVVARFYKGSERYASLLAQKLVATVGQPWRAIFLFSSDCNSAPAIENILVSTDHDARIGFGLEDGDTEASDVVVFVEGGGLLRSHALTVFADALRNTPGALLAYSDEDRYRDEGVPSDPWFKPRFSSLLNCQGLLLGRVFAFKLDGQEGEKILEKLCAGSLDEASGFARDYAETVGEKHVLHIPHVLFHDALEPAPPIQVGWDLPEVLPFVSIIIPTKDRWDLMGPCLESIWLSDWPREFFEVIVVDNGSTDPLTLKMLEQLKIEGKIRVIRDDLQFNWSRLNNLAAGEAVGDLLIFLNNDTKVDDIAWIKKLAKHALRPGVGAVGCKLLFPDRTVQHGGVVAGIQGVAGHAHLFLGANEGGYNNLANVTREVSAVTGACLAVSRDNFRLAVGFDENFKVAFNDVVFCFTLHQLGLRNVYVADPLLIHYESKSRGYDDTAEKQALNREETMKAWNIHASLMRDDPFYSPNLSLWKPYELSFSPRRRAVWDAPANRPLKVMFLSCTHAVGHGVPVVLALQAEALVKRGYDVIVAGPCSANDFPYPGCHRLEVHDPIEAAVLAADHSVDVIIAQTTPFFSVARWTGEYPRVICYDHGEPPSDWFPDASHRRAVLAEKDVSLSMSTAVYAISDAVAAESRTRVDGIIPEGNTHLGQWSQAAAARRELVREKLGWTDRFVVLNVCRFHSGERVYKGVDTYAAVRDALRLSNSELWTKTIFVLCGKGRQEDVAAMTARGLVVHANVTNDEMLDLYCAADAYANFSKWEGYNLGVSQALAMGLPTIASDIPAHRAFGIDVTNSEEHAADWLTRVEGVNAPRAPRLLGWDEPLSKLIHVVDSVVAQYKGPLC